MTVRLGKSYLGFSDFFFSYVKIITSTFGSFMSVGALRGQWNSFAVHSEWRWVEEAFKGTFIYSLSRAFALWERYHTPISDVSHNKHNSIFHFFPTILVPFQPPGPPSWPPRHRDQEFQRKKTNLTLGFEPRTHGLRGHDATTIATKPQLHVMLMGHLRHFAKLQFERYRNFYLFSIRFRLTFKCSIWFQI